MIFIDCVVSYDADVIGCSEPELDPVVADVDYGNRD